MAIANPNTVLGTILPDVYIRKITLETSGQVVKERNPHIDHEREPDVIRNPETGKIERSITVPNLINKTNTSDSLKVRVDLLLKEVLDNGFVASWFGNQDLLKYMSVKIVLSQNDGLTDRLATRQVAPTSLDRKVEGFSQTQQVELAQLIGATKLSQYSSKTNNDGNRVYDVSFSTVFEMKVSDPHHLAVFAVAYLDAEALAKDFSLDLPAGMLRALSGRIASELIIDAGELASESYVFLDEQGYVWTGETHQTKNGQWRTGASEASDSQFLELTTISNNKIQDFRDLKTLERLQLNFSVIQNDLFPQIDGFKLQTNDRILPVRIPTYCTDLMMSRDANGHARFAFGLDFRHMVRENTVFGKLYRDDNVHLLQNVRIRSMIVKRVRVSTNQQGLRSNLGLIQFNSEDPIENIAYSKEIEPGNFATSDNPNGVLREVNVGAGSDAGVRHFTAIDKSMASVTFGLYQYGIDLEIEDNTADYIVDMINRLNEAAYLLNEYQQAGSRKDSFSIADNRFTETFIQEQERRYATRIEQAPWILGLAIYLEALDVLFESFDRVRFARCLSIFVHPRTGNINGINTIVKLIQNLIIRLESIIGVNGNIKKRSLGQSSQLATVSISRGAKKPRSFRYEKYFSEIFDSDIPKKTGYDFLSLDDDDEPNQDGLAVVSAIKYNERANKEILKYFKATDTDINIKSKTQTYTADDSLENQKYAYFTPSRVDLGTIQKSQGFLDQGEGLFEANNTKRVATNIIRFNALKKSPQIATYRFVPNENSKLTATEQEVKHNLLSIVEGYGITVESPQLARTKQISVSKADSSDPMIDAARVVATGSALNEDGLVLERSECGLKDEESADAQNPNSLILSVMTTVFNKGFNTPLAEDKRSREATAKASTIRVFDLNDPNNGIDQSTIRRNRSVPPSPSGQTRVESGPVVSQPRQLAVKELPNQVKSLLLESVSSDKTNRNWFALKENDPLADPQQNLVFQLNYKNIQQVEVLTGYRTSDAEGTRQIKEPIWSKMTLALFNESVGRNLLCRFRGYENKDLCIKQPETMKLPVYNKYFIINSEEEFVAPLGDPDTLDPLQLQDNVRTIVEPKLKQQDNVRTIVEPKLKQQNNVRTIVEPKLKQQNNVRTIVEPNPKFARIVGMLKVANAQQEVYAAEYGSSLFTANTKAPKSQFTRSNVVGANVRGPSTVSAVPPSKAVRVPPKTDTRKLASAGLIISKI